jgi:urea transport system permease protein
MQQVFRSTFGAKEVSPSLPDWLMGSWAPADGMDIPINGLFVMALTLLVTGGVLLRCTARAGACGCVPR